MHDLQQLLFPALIVGWMVYRQLREQRKRMATLWIVPAILVAFALWGVVATVALHPNAVIGLLAGLVFGAGVGALRLRFMRVEASPETGEVVTQGSPWLILFLAVLLGLKRFVLPTALHDVGMAGMQLMDFGLGSAIAMLTVRTGGMYRVYFEAKRKAGEALPPAAEAPGAVEAG